MKARVIPAIAEFRQLQNIGRGLLVRPAADLKPKGFFPGLPDCLRSEEACYAHIGYRGFF